MVSEAHWVILLFDWQSFSYHQLHAQSAGFKALTTDLAAEGVEICRRSCGGHGYLRASALPVLLDGIVAAVTYEGENTVLYLQTARYWWMV